MATLERESSSDQGLLGFRQLSIRACLVSVAFLSSRNLILVMFLLPNACDSRLLLIPTESESVKMACIGRY